MNFESALKILSTFSACHLRIYKEFSGFPEADSKEGESGYVVFADASLVKNQCYCELRDFAEANNLNITPFGQYLMVSGQ
jgi:hypothetical protein